MESPSSSLKISERLRLPGGSPPKVVHPTRTPSASLKLGERLKQAAAQNEISSTYLIPQKSPSNATGQPAFRASNSFDTPVAGIPRVSPSGPVGATPPLVEEVTQLSTEDAAIFAAANFAPKDFTEESQPEPLVVAPVEEKQPEPPFVAPLEVKEEKAEEAAVETKTPTTPEATPAPAPLPVAPLPLPIGLTPPTLPQSSTSKIKDLRSSLLEKKAKEELRPGEAKPASPEPTKPKPLDLLKPPAPSIPKPPPPTLPKPKPLAVKEGAPKPLVAPVSAPPVPKVAPEPVPENAPLVAPEAPTDAPALLEESPAEDLAESIGDLADFAELNEEIPQKSEVPSLESLAEIEAHVEHLQSISGELDIIPLEEEPAKEESNPFEEPEPNLDDMEVALEAVEEHEPALTSQSIPSVPAPVTPNSPARTRSEELSEASLVALSLDKATSAVDDLFSALSEPQPTQTPPQPSLTPPPIELPRPLMPPPMGNPIQSAKSISLELDEVELVDEAPTEEIGVLAERAANYRREERWRELIEVLRQIQKHSQDPSPLYVEIGDLYWEKLQSRDEAIASYQKAMEKKSREEPFLEKLVGRYMEASRFEEAFECIERLGALATSPNGRARRYFDAAVALHQKYQQTEAALELFNETLDIDLGVLEAFEQIDRILTKKRDWNLLEQNYRRMLRRVPDSRPELLIVLWHALGEIYRTRLGMLQKAAEAFEEASRLDPANPVRQKILAEIYAADPSQWERTAEHERRLLATTEDINRSLHALFWIYHRADQKDRAFCVASVLSSMGLSSPEEDAFYSQGLGSIPRSPTRPLDDDLFRRLICTKEEDSYLSSIFRLIVPYAAPLYAHSEKELGLHKKERIELASSKYAFARTMQEALWRLQAPLPFVYVNPTPGPEEPPNTGLDLEPLLIEKMFVPGVVVGPLALSPKREADSLFLLARHLVYLRPEYVLIRLCRVHQGVLRTLLRAAILLANPSLTPPKDEEEEVQQIAKQLSKTVPQSVLGQIKVLIEEAISRGNDFSTTVWMAQVELAATRAAFVLCGDLEAAQRCLQFDSTPLSVLSTKAKLHDLRLYIVSEEYSALREELKIVWPKNR